MVEVDGKARFVPVRGRRRWNRTGRTGDQMSSCVALFRGLPLLARRVHLSRCSMKPEIPAGSNACSWYAATNLKLEFGVLSTETALLPAVNVNIARCQ